MGTNLFKAVAICDFEFTRSNLRRILLLKNKGVPTHEDCIQSRVKTFRPKGKKVTFYEWELNEQEYKEHLKQRNPSETTNNNRR